MPSRRRQAQSVTRHHSTSYNLFMLALTLFSLLVMAGLVIGPAFDSSNAVLWRVDFFLCVIFFVDFLLTLRRAPSKRTYFFKQGGWLDLLGSIPALRVRPWTALLRLARLNRLVRIVGYLQGKDREEMLEEAREQPAHTALYSIVLAAIVLITAASLLILPLERGVAGAEIRSGADAVWWSIVTATTVGYGDYTPVTFPGRLVAIVLMLFGIGIFAVLTNLVAARLGALQDDKEDIARILGENAAIRAELAEIKELLKGQDSVARDGPRGGGGGDQHKEEIE